MDEKKVVYLLVKAPKNFYIREKQTFFKFLKRADSFHERIAEELDSRQFRLQSFDPFFDFLEPSSRVKSQNPFYEFWSTHQSRVRTGCFII
jgi:hypothetical protein